MAKAAESLPEKSENRNRDADLQTVIDLVLHQEERRREDERLRRENEARQAEKQQRLSDARLREAIHVIKWCVVGICAAMVIAVVLGIWALIQIENAVVEVERDVESVTHRVDNILHEVEHPFEGAGRLLGRDLDRSVAEFFGLSAAKENK